jgi:hypothetical protein
MYYVGGQHEHFQFYSTLNNDIKHIFPVGTSIRKSHYFSPPYVVLGRPHTKTLFTQPYPHNGLL